MTDLDRLDALAGAATPTTVKGLALRGALRRKRRMPDTEVDWSAWIAGIEAEARDAAVRERDELREALIRLTEADQRDQIGDHIFAINAALHREAGA